MREMARRKRELVEAEMLIVANDHWNFDVRGFNPGGNHGSFFRISTHSVFMIAGGTKTNVAEGFQHRNALRQSQFCADAVGINRKFTR